MAALDFPDTPTVGQLYGSSGTVWRWDGARWASTAGASGARGTVAYRARTQTSVGIPTAWSSMGMAVTWVASPTRTYRTTVMGELRSANANAVAGVQIGDTINGVVKQEQYIPLNGANYSHSITVSCVETGLSGTQGRDVNVAFVVAPNGDWVATPTAPSYILVEDITYEAGTSGTPGAGPKTGAAVVPAFESTASATYLDLATVGPVVTIDTATSALVTLSCGCNISVAGNTGVMGVAVSGATTIAASANSGLACFDAEVNNTSDYSRQIVVTGLNAGLNIFTAKYATNSSTATFSKRVLSVQAL